MINKRFTLSAIALSLALISQVQAQTVPSVDYTYDAKGNLLSETNGLGERTEYQYDLLDRVTQINLPQSGSINLQQNSQDQLTQVIDPLGQATGYQYSPFGDLLNQQSPDTGGTRYQYNDKGQLITSQDAKGQQTSYRYETLGRLSQITYADGQQQTFEYDNGANAKGRLIKATDGHSGSTLSWQYTAQGQVAEKKQTTTNGMDLSIKYEHDAVGRLIGITYPSGQTLGMAYSATEVIYMQVDSVGKIVGDFSYDSAGHFLGAWVAWAYQSRQYDEQGRVSQYSTEWQNNTLTYDAAGRVIAISSPSSNRQYSYDPQGQLIHEEYGSTVIDYQYDANGNRISQTRNGQRQDSPIQSGNRQSGVQYDANGSVIDDGPRQYSYLSNGRLGSVTKDGEQTHYRYNAQGERIAKQNSSETVYYLYDEAGRLMGEYDQNNRAQVEYFWLGEQPIGMFQYDEWGNTTFFGIETDHLNTPRAVTDVWSRSYWRWDSDAFGSDAPDENPLGLGHFEFNLRFPGQYYDKESGLHYNYFRDYDPKTGRYIESDPIGLEGGINTYVYAKGNPLLFKDFTGLFPSPVAPMQDKEYCDSGCNKTWDSCYTKCLDTLAPGAKNMYLALNFASYATTGTSVYYNKGVRVATWPRFGGAAGSAASRGSGAAMAVGVGWIGGSSAGCMLSCSINRCNY